MVLERGWWEGLLKNTSKRGTGKGGLLLQAFRGVEEQQGGGPVGKTGARTPLPTTYGLGTKVGELKRELHDVAIIHQGPNGYSRGRGIPGTDTPLGAIRSLQGWDRKERGGTPLQRHCCTSGRDGR